MKGTENMSSERDIINFLNGCEEMISAIVAQTCTDYFADSRHLMNGEYYDPSDPKALNEYKKGNKMVKYINRKTLENKIAGYREWFLNPASDFNSYWKAMSSQMTGEESTLDGKNILARLDDMIADTTTYPETWHSFRQNSTNEEDNNLEEEEE